MRLSTCSVVISSERRPIRSLVPLQKPKAHEASLLVDQGAGVVAPEPHRPPATGKQNALLDLVFAE